MGQLDFVAVEQFIIAAIRRELEVCGLVVDLKDEIYSISGSASGSSSDAPATIAILTDVVGVVGYALELGSPDVYLIWTAATTASIVNDVIFAGGELAGHYEIERGSFARGSVFTYLPFAFVVLHPNLVACLPLEHTSGAHGGAGVRSYG